MKRIATLALVAALLLMALAACSDKADQDDTTTEPPSTTAPATAPPTTAPAKTISAGDVTVAATPGTQAERPEFAAKDHVTDDELASMHGYKIGMTFAETQRIWKIPQDMVDYAVQRLMSGETTSLCVYTGNIYYDFVPGYEASNYDGYILNLIYCGETAYCENREQLSVLRDINLGTMIADALKSLPGKRTPKQWAIDQLYGEYGKPDSASLEYTIKTGFYDLQIYGETVWARLTFGSSGKLWYAEIRPIN